MRTAGNEHLSKAEWRERLTGARSAVPTARRVAEAGALARHVADLPHATTVCGYVPFGSEPGSLALLDVLLAAGSRVLLPVVPPAPGPLDWAEYTGSSSLAPGRFRGVLEPTGDRLGESAVELAELVLVPALAVDHHGVRLGRGAGFYDRSLGATSRADLVAIVRDEELVPRLPAEPHDALMSGVLLPGRGLVRLPLTLPESAS
ncbi:5-formyltetrahydrofolate cyclo-ligase [Amycolatopsis magusensis]|uniref:5-formyltetrahydrofolate cyclo-ligase n=1 Tax=Amycolatopsis magusensis TaxID=882444 RepID=A0ABS4PHK6_9PSEU|nr:5-formyltetrahydrofolate cyclo-ligase [Amycolatopsis magusensis]MBP2178881.1 5-formyltetrahydrofolate cyclo-ligase [Amycolatopsis magusensis]